MKDWEETLNDLEKDPRLTADRLDWSAKHRLIEQFREAEGLPPEDPWLQSLDLSYHLLDREQGVRRPDLQQRFRRAAHHAR